MRRHCCWPHVALITRHAASGSAILSTPMGAAVRADDFAPAPRSIFGRNLQREELPLPPLDLSLPWTHASIFNDNAVFDGLSKATSTEIISYLVVRRQKIVAEYYQAGLATSLDRHRVFSVTKTFISVLVGCMLDQGLLASVDVTLGEIWRSHDTLWAQVEHAKQKQGITIRELLTHTSGLDVDNIQPSGTLLEALNHVNFQNTTRGSFNYLSTSMVMSYVILECTRKTPWDYAFEVLLPALGIAENDLEWDTNAAGIQKPFVGLHMTARQMAKLGQLYLQGGLAGPTSRVVSQAWVASSTRNQISDASDGSNAYGYLWRLSGCPPHRNDTYFAAGFNGQLVCVFTGLEVVLVVQSSSTAAALNLMYLLPHLYADRLSSTEFKQIENGTCNDAGLFIIHEAYMCGVAAASLGLTSQACSRSRQLSACKMRLADRPYGCYWDLLGDAGHHLFVSLNNANSGIGAQRNRHVICASEDLCSSIAAPRARSSSANEQLHDVNGCKGKHLLIAIALVLLSTARMWFDACV